MFIMLILKTWWPLDKLSLRFRTDRLVWALGPVWSAYLCKKEKKEKRGGGGGKGDDECDGETINNLESM